MRFFRKASILGGILLALPMLAMASGGSPSTATSAPDPELRPILDDQGREVILHGLNSSNSAKNNYLGRPWETEADVAHQAKNLGFNSVRYLIFWKEIMPSPGVINTAYLDDVEARLQWYANHNMHVILDMHQDNWGPGCGGNGAPEWTTVGTPEAADGPWWLKAASPCYIDSTNAFWFNNGDIQGYYAQAWKAVAQRFANHPAVIGYDLMNEPNQIDALIDQIMYEKLDSTTLGVLNAATLLTVWVDGHPYNPSSGIIKDQLRNLAAAEGLTIPESYIEAVTHRIISRNKADWGTFNALKEFESGMLTSMYQRVINDIRTVDSNNYIFVEGMSASVNQGFPTYIGALTDPRSGDRRLGYIPHMYPRALHEGAAYGQADFEIIKNWQQNQVKFARTNNLVLMLGEFGHSNAAPNALQFFHDAVDMTENSGIGFSYWSSDKGNGWSPIAADGVSDTLNTPALSRIYPRAVAGVIDAFDFNHKNQTFYLQYHNSNALGTTDIALPPRYQASQGLTVSTTTDGDPGQWSYNIDTVNNILQIQHNPSVNNHIFTVRVAGTGDVKSGESLQYTAIPKPTCPDHGASFDGANCHILTQVGGVSYWDYDGAVYYTPVPQPTCPDHGASFDGANCFLFTRVSGVNYWEYNGAQYYTPPSAGSCPYHGASFDGANCYMFTKRSDRSYWTYNGSHYYTAVNQPTCPHHGASFDGANCYVYTIRSDRNYWTYEGSQYYTPVNVPTCPYNGAVYDGTSCWVTNLLAGLSYFDYDGGFYYGAIPGANACPYHGAGFDGANCKIMDKPAGVNYWTYAYENLFNVISMKPFYSSQDERAFLAGGLTLLAGQEVVTTKTRLVMQSDGNLVLYSSNGTALWATGTSGQGGAKAIFQSDGNLVVYTDAGSALWSSGTQNQGAYKLALQSDMNMVIYNNSNVALWSTGTAQ